MKFFRNSRGYFWRNWCATLCGIGTEYSIQVRIPFVKWAVLTVYRGSAKPKFRNLGIISLVFFPFFVWTVFKVLFFLIAAIVAVPFLIASIFFKVLALCLIFEFRDAKNEVVRLLSNFSRQLR